MLKDRWAYIRLTAALALSKIDPSVEELVPTLIEFVRKMKCGEGWSDGRAAIKALGRCDFRDQRVSDILLELLGEYTDSTGIIREEAVEAIAGNIAGLKASLPGLRGALSDKVRAVRVRAAAAVWKVSEDADACLPVLLEAAAVKGDGAHERIESDMLEIITETLQTIARHDKRAVGGLLQIITMEDSNSEGWRRAVGALRIVDPEKGRQLGY